MKRQPLILSLILVLAVIGLTLNSCKKDTTPVTLSLSTLVAGSIDLNGATSPNNVPVNAAITATFNTDVDAMTATTSNITLSRDYDNASMDITVTASGKTVTITPASTLGNGTLYKLTFKAALKSTAGESLTADVQRAFTTEGSFLPAGTFAYWNFENNANDQVGSFNPITNGVTDITYVDSRNAAAGKAASFNGTTSLIEIGNGDQLMNTTDFTLSFWIKEDTAGRADQFVLGLAGWYGFQFELNNSSGGWCKLAAQYSLSGGTTASQDLWFNGAATGTTKDNGGYLGWTYSQDLSNSGGVVSLFANQWAYVVCTYASATKIGTLYINGMKMKEQDFNLYDNALNNATGLEYAGNVDNKQLVFGFIQDKTAPTITDSWADYTNPANNHYKGLLDDIRIFHRALTTKEVQLIYASEKP